MDRLLSFAGRKAGGFAWFGRILRGRAAKYREQKVSCLSSVGTAAAASSPTDDRGRGMKARRPGKFCRGTDARCRGNGHTQVASVVRSSPHAMRARSALACGIDVVDIDRFRRLVTLRGRRVLEIVFTRDELAECQDRLDWLAARFAAKEAVAKALGCGIGLVGWHELETIAGADRRPRVRLHGRAARRALEHGFVRWSVALSQSRTVAAAVVIASGSAARLARLPAWDGSER